MEKRKIKQIILVLILIISKQVAAQVDTVIYAPKGYSIEKTCNNRGKRCTYKVDDRKVTKAEYGVLSAEQEKVENCKPCWFIYKDSLGKLIYEGDFYQDCCIGTYIERYDNGELKVKGQYKTPLNKKPDYSQGDCRRDGSWTYYKENGDIDKKELYINGELIKK